MGYYTDHSLKVKNLNSQDNARLEQVLRDKELIGYAFWEPTFYNDFVEYPVYDSVKWYEAESDMKEISEMFPDAVFELSGIGEDFGDVWRSYFKNGECEHCPGEIVYKQPQKIKW